VSGEAFSAKRREATIGSDDATATSSCGWRLRSHGEAHAAGEAKGHQLSRPFRILTPLFSLPLK
jgi:hypothetical protein